MSSIGKNLPSANPASAATATGAGNYRWLLAAVLGLGIGLRLWLWWSTDFTIGDAFIQFRFAEQFAAGNGLVFNAGEPVGGNTSLLYSLLLGLGACTGIGVPTVARLIGIASDVGSLLLLWNLTRREGGIQSPALRVAMVAAVFLCPYLFFYSVCGMETSWYLLVCLFFLDRTLRGADWVWYVAVALVFFSRPDGVLLVAAGLLFTGIRTRHLPWRPLAGTFVIGLAYLGFNHLAYGSVVPLTVKVKSVFFHNTVADNFNYLADRFFLHRPWLLAVYLGVALGLVILRRDRAPVVLFGQAAAAYLLFVLTAPYLRTWYLVPFLTLSACTMLLAVAAWAEEARWPALDRIGLGLLAVYLVGCGLAYRLVFRECGVWRERIRDLQEAAGTWLRENTPADANIFVTALETGYFAKRHTWDTPGLVTPRILELYAAGQPMSLLEVADHLGVDYAVLPDLEQTNHHPQFRRVKTFGTQRSAAHVGLGDGAYSVFERVRSESDSGQP